MKTMSAAWTLGVAAALTAAGGGPVPAQEVQSPEGHRVLSATDALRLASEHSPQYRRALNQMDLSGPQARQAWGAFLPSLSLSYGTAQSFARQETAVDFFGNPVENPQVETRVTSYANQGASLSVDLFQGGRRFHEMGRARAESEVSRRAGERELNSILADVQRQFLAAQRQRAQLAVEEELLAARERDYQVTRRLFDLASVGRSDVLATELEVESQRVAVTQARGEYRKSLLALRRAVGDPSLVSFDVEEREPQPFDPATFDMEALVSRALSDSPQLREAEASLRVQQAALKAERSSRWPTLSLNSGISRGSYGPDQSALFDVTPNDLNGSVGLTVSIPLFTQFQTSYSIAQADVNLRNATESIRETELVLEEEVRARFVDLETAWAALSERSRRLDIAAERLRILREEYRLATKSIEDLQTAIRDHASARRDALDQRYEFALALVALHEAAGVIAVEAGIDSGVRVTN